MAREAGDFWRQSRTALHSCGAQSGKRNEEYGNRYDEKPGTLDEMMAASMLAEHFPIGVERQHSVLQNNRVAKGFARV
jgi:hypothetical protein